jgi:hypothetical protein
MDQAQVVIVTGVLRTLHLIHILHLTQILMDIIHTEVATTMETIITVSKDNGNKEKCKL